MAKKSKNKKKKLQSKPSDVSTEKKLNPFELRINRERYSILGRRLKHDKGMPGVSRSKALSRRTEIFKKQNMLTEKSNRFIDKRIGKNDDAVLSDDRIIARLVKERQKKYKKNIYNLNDEEELTHFGKPVSELDTFDNPSSDDDDEEDEAQLDENFVNRAHFGGFLLKKGDEQEPAKTHKEIIGDLIMESKRKKQERKVERELNDDLTEKLDKEWKELQSIMVNLKNAKNENEKAKIDNFDMIVRELKFEPRGTPTSRVQTKEELDSLEEKKLKKLEEERILRMQGIENLKREKIHYELSADSIYDGLNITNDFDSVVADSDQEESNKDNDDGDDSSNASEKSDSSEENGNSDLESEDGSDKEDLFRNEKIEESNNDAKDCVSSKNVSKITSVPLSSEQLSELLKDHSVTEISNIMDNVLKISSSNKTQALELDNFFKVILEYIEMCYKKHCLNLNVLDILIPYVYKLADRSPQNTAEMFRNILLKKINDFQSCIKRSGIDNFPDFTYLVILKLCGIIYSTSDFRHPVVTPAMLLMSDILTSSYFLSYKNILTRVFISNLFLEYVSYSKRFVPETIIFLNSLLYLSCVRNEHIFKNFAYLFKSKNSILLINSIEKQGPSPINLKYLIASVNPDEESILKISIIYNTVWQLTQFAELYVGLPSFYDIFQETFALLEALPLKFYPTKLREIIENLKQYITENKKCKKYLTFPHKKPKPLKLFEPRIESVFDTEAQSISKKIKLEKQLSQKVKREEKGVMREIRRDAQFAAAKQLRERIKADKERKRKVKQLYHDLAVQEGEYKKLVKKK